MTTTNQASSDASMTNPTVGQKSLVVVGATGMVGGYALRYALDNSEVKSVTSIGRKKLGTSHPKLKEVLHQNFADCSALSDVLSGQDGAVFCLGTYTGSVSDAELHRITVDYTVDFSRVLRGSSPGATFSFLSGNGADPTGRSEVPSSVGEHPSCRWRRCHPIHPVDQPHLYSPWSPEHGDPNRSSEAHDGRDHPAFRQARVFRHGLEERITLPESKDTSEVAAIDVGKRSVDARWPLAPCVGPSGMAIDPEQRRLFSVCSGTPIGGF